jgi:hypothetical protein
LSSKSDGSLSFFSSSNASTTLGGKASLQPKRTPVTNEEIDAVLVCKISLLVLGRSHFPITLVTYHAHKTTHFWTDKGTINY